MFNRKPQKSLQDKLPIFNIEDNKVVMRDGRVAIGFQMNNLEMETVTASFLEQFTNELGRGMKGLAEGTVMQKIDLYYDRRHEAPQGELSYYEKKMHEHFQDRLVLQHESYFFVSIPRQLKKKFGKLNPITSGFSSSTTYLDNPLENIGNALREAESQARLFVKLFENFDIQLHRLSDDALNDLYVRILNCEFAQDVQDVHCEMYNDLSGLSVGHRRVNIVSLTRPGEEIYSSVKNGLKVDCPYGFNLAQYLQFPHILTQTMIIRNTSTEIKALDGERKLMEKLNGTWLGDQDNELKSEHIREYTTYVRTNGSQLIDMALNVTIFPADASERDYQLSEVKTAFRNMQDAKCLEESYDTAAIFMANLPGNGFHHYRFCPMPAEWACCYTNVITSYHSDPYGDYLADRWRNLMRVPLFNTRLDNQNVVLVGPSGSGKSFTVGAFISQRKERGARQIIIDKGGTYKNVLESLNGDEFDTTYFEYDPENPLRLNPFLVDKKDGKWFLTSDKSTYIITILSTIWKGASNDRDNLTPAERSIFQQSLPRYYRHLNEHPSELPCMSSFYQFIRSYHEEKLAAKDPDYLIETKYFDVNQFLIVLRPFVDGQYKEVLNAPNTMDISAYDLVCFDMDRIKNDQVLSPVVTIVIAELTMDMIRKYPDEVKYIYMDEAWSFLKGSLQNFIEYMYRTIRKNNGSMNIITQSIHEINESDIGKAILINADTKIILRFKDPGEVVKLATIVGLTDHEQDLINSMRSESDFREIFIKQGTVSKVYVLEATKELSAVLTSKPSERNYLRKLIKRYRGNIRYAVQQFNQDKEQGLLAQAS